VCAPPLPPLVRFATPAWRVRRTPPACHSVPTAAASEQPPALRRTRAPSREHACAVIYVHVWYQMRARSTLRGSHATGAALLPRLQSQHGSPHRYHTVQAAVRILNPNTGSGCVAYTCAAPASPQCGPHTCSYSSMHQVQGVTRTQRRRTHAGTRHCIQ